ncbi:MAG: ureidoglycolate lyase [Hyphomicrobiaceae bacterium]
MLPTIPIEPLTIEAFTPFGDVIEISSAPTIMINGGMCGRFDDLAHLDFVDEGRAGISIFQAQGYQLPLKLEMVERPPHGSQAFLPAASSPFLVIVCPDANGSPGKPRAFLTESGQGVNYNRGIWHGVLTPLEPSCFFVVDRIGPGLNLEEHWFDTPFIIQTNQVERSCS